MKTKILIFLAIYTSLGALAQNNSLKSNDQSRIVLNTFVDNLNSEVSSGAKKVLENKLSRLVMKNGFSGDGIDPRFIITAKIDVLTEDITPTAPPMIALNLGVTIMVGDAIKGVKFDSEYVEIKGVGTNKTKAYINAIKRVNVNSKELNNLVSNSKGKIVQYYDNNCDFILTEAKNLHSQRLYDDAIYKLSGIPSVSIKCYNKSSVILNEYYKDKISFDCKTKLNEAKSVWNASLDRDGANKASEILSEINPEARCYPEVKKLYAQIASRVKELDKREWNYVLKNQKQESERIDAIRAIGVAKGRNQPKTIYKIDLIRGW